MSINVNIRKYEVMDLGSYGPKPKELHEKGTHDGARLLWPLENRENEAQAAACTSRAKNALADAHSILSMEMAVKNRDLWEQILMLAEVHTIEWMKIEKQAGDPIHERCHILAHTEMEKV